MFAQPDPTSAGAGPDPIGTARSTAYGAAAAERAATAGAIIGRIWEVRRHAESQPGWQRPLAGMLIAIWFALVAAPDLLPGGLVAAFALMAVVVIALVVIAVVATRRGSVRGHTGNVTVPGRAARPWWSSPAMAGPAVLSLIFLGRMSGVFDHWPVVAASAVVVGVAVALALPRFETADHVTGAHLEHPPVLSTEGEAAVARGELTPDVLELLVLQHHTGERRISWCADILAVGIPDIRDRIARGRQWLELPATEVHDPDAATWVRLTAPGREALGYV